MSRPGPVARSPLERFLDRLLLQPNGCWTLGDISEKRYSEVTLADGRRIGGHRFAYEWLIGPIPEGFQLDHLCRRPHCVNPGHLEPVEPRENYLRGVGPAAQNARKTCCPQGHLLSGGNLYIHPKTGRRDCAECRRRAVQRYRTRRAT